MRYDIIFERAYVGKHFLRAKKESLKPVEDLRVANKSDYKKKFFVVWHYALSGVFHHIPTLYRLEVFVNPKFKKGDVTRIKTHYGLRKDMFFMRDRNISGKKDRRLIAFPRNFSGKGVNFIPLFIGVVKKFV